MLTVLCFSTRPLTIEELIDAHAVDLGVSPHLDREGRLYDQDDLIDICLGLVEIAETDDENGKKSSIARIAHFSVQEYLRSERIHQQKAMRFALQSGPANAEIAQICLVYLLEPTLSKGTLDAAKEKEFPLARFAATYWHYHYANSQGGKTKVEELLRRLFQDKNCFLTWINLYDMDRPWLPKWGYQHAIGDTGSPLYYASLLGLESVLSSMIPRDASERLLKRVNTQGGMNGNTLQAASLRDHGKVVQMLLDRGADANAQLGADGSALHIACRWGHEKVVQILLDRGADINAQDRECENALQTASFMGHEEVVQMLLDRGADISNQGGYYGNALQAAALKGYEKIVQMLLDRGADVSAQGGYYGNALQAASRVGHEKTVQILLDRGSNVNAQGGEYGHSLQAACRGDHEKVVQMLLDRGAYVNAQGGADATVMPSRPHLSGATKRWCKCY